MVRLSSIRFKCIRFKSFLRSSIVLLAPLGCFDFYPPAGESYGNASRMHGAELKSPKQHPREKYIEEKNVALAPQRCSSQSPCNMLEKETTMSNSLVDHCSSFKNSSSSFSSSSLGKKIVSSTTTELEDDSLEKKSSKEEHKILQKPESYKMDQVFNKNFDVEFSHKNSTVTFEQVDFECATGICNIEEISSFKKVTNSLPTQVSLPVKQQQWLSKDNYHDSVKKVTSQLDQENVRFNNPFVEEASGTEIEMWKWVDSLSHYELNASQAEEDLFNRAESWKHYSFMAISTEKKMPEWLKEFENLDEDALQQELAMVDWVTDFFPFYEVSATWKEVEMQDWLSRLIYSTNPWFDIKCKEVYPSRQWTKSGPTLNWW